MYFISHGQYVGSVFLRTYSKTPHFAQTPPPTMNISLATETETANAMLNTQQPCRQVR